MVFRLYLSLSEIFHCFHDNLNSTMKKLRPPIFDKSKINFIHCIEDPEVTSGWLFTSVRFFWFMVFNTIFNNISVISSRSVLLVEEAGVPGENHRVYHIMLYWTWFQLTTLVVIASAGSLLGERILSLWLEYHPFFSTNHFR